MCVREREREKEERTNEYFAWLVVCFAHQNAYVMKHGSGKSRGIGYLNYASRAEMIAALDEIDQAEQARYNQAATAGSGGPWIAGTPLAMSSDQRFDAGRETSTDM